MEGQTAPGRRKVDIGRITIRYEAAADRLRITVTGKDGRAALLLTRRLAMQWLKTLAEWLQAHPDPVVGLEIEHARALGRLRRAADAPPTEPDPRPAGDPALITSIKCAQGKQSIRIDFYTDEKEALAGGTFGRVAVHGLLDRLARAMDRAGWGSPLPVPEWSRAGSEEPPPGRGKATLH